MRVVCDNCGAVYKIADSKLSKDVNKATCKRCGHKIVIYKPGFRPPQGPPKNAPAESDGEERTVIKSVEGLDKLGQSSGNMPAIGSLTAELRAISLPGIKPVAPAPPAALRPVGAGPVLPPKLPPVPPQSLGMPPKAPPMGIPPKDSPPTAHYGGPRPSLPQVPGVPVAPPPSTPGEGDKTRPMTQPPAPSNGGAPVVRPVIGRAAPTPSLKTPVVARQPSIKTPIVPTPPPAAAKPAPPPVVHGAPDAKPSTQGDGSAELGVVAGLGAVGLLGAATAALLPAPLSSAGIGLAGFAAATCLFLSILSQRGRKKGQAFAAVFIGLLIGSAIGFLAQTRSDEVASAGTGMTSELPDPIPPVVDPTPAPLPDPEGGEEEPTEEDALSEEERAEARRFSSEEISGLGGASQPTPAPKAVTEPTPAPRREPTPAPRVEPKKEEPTPKAEPTGRRPVGPGAPPPESTPKPASGGAAGPSPFVVDTIIRNNANIQRCFSLEKTRGTDISGKIYLKFSIAPDGKVTRARITTSRFAGTALDQCVSKEVNQLKFPPFDGESQNVRYPFNVL